MSPEEIENEKIKDPTDVRHARKRFGQYLLKRLLRAIDAYKKDENMLGTLSRRVRITQKRFVGYAEEYDFLNVCKTLEEI